MLILLSSEETLDLWATETLLAFLSSCQMLLRFRHGFLLAFQLPLSWRPSVCGGSWSTDTIHSLWNSPSLLNLLFLTILWRLQSSLLFVHSTLTTVMPFIVTLCDFTLKPMFNCIVIIFLQKKLLWPLNAQEYHVFHIEITFLCSIWKNLDFTHLIGTSKKRRLNYDWTLSAMN